MISNRSRLLAEVDGDDRRRRSWALELLEAGLASVDAGRVTRSALACLEAGGMHLEGAAVLAFGKASRAMAEAALAEFAPCGGLVVGHDAGRLGNLAMLAAGHPIPLAESEAHGRRVQAFADSLGADDLVICLVSGGASAMLEVPRIGLSMADLAATTACLLHAGAAIEELNAVRVALSDVKGGRLLARLHPARVINLVISDVPGAPPAVVGSGPTMPPVAGGSARPDAGEVISKYGVADSLPSSVMACLADPGGRAPVDLPMDLRVETVVAANNLTAQSAMIERARSLGLEPRHRSDPVVGEARDAGAAAWHCCRRHGRCVVFGGETTVTVRGTGRGGRNQELVLGALAAQAGDAQALDRSASGSPSPSITVGLLAALGTDGVDGSSDAAGAFLDGPAVVRAGVLGLDIAAALARNDSHRFFAELGTAIETGRTGTNVADVGIWLP